MSRAPIRAGFTLIEILIVVVILGFLATIVMALFNTGKDDAERSAFTSSIRTFGDAARYYHFKEAEYPADGSSGLVPPGFEPYINEGHWTSPTPIGGVWDTELNSYGVTSALGVHFDGTGETRDDAFMVQIDAMIDDGNLATGMFRKLDGDRYYVVIAN